MERPNLKSSYVKICYTADDGYRAETAYSSKRSLSPQHCLAAAADELGRIAELFDCGDAVEDAIQEARQRVRDWFAAREKPNATREGDRPDDHVSR